MKKNALLSFLLVAGILLALFAVNGFAPFGERSLAIDDARIQYLDLFLYYKDVLAGRNSISYTFSKLLGGSAIALFSYYLASPLNLLIVFFPDNEILSFFDLLVLLKAALAAAAFSVFLSIRFRNRMDAERSRLISVFLSAGYGLSQYMLSQFGNPMWLDGVILLPFILLGVYEVVNGRAFWRLAVPVTLSVLFNWYSAGMNCLFTFVWFVLEASLLAAEPGKIFRWKEFSRAILRYVGGMLTGLLCSAFLFLPTVYALTGNPKGTLNFWALLLPQIRVPLYVPLESTIYGARSTETSLSLFCGILPIVGICSLFSKKERPAVKLIFGLFLLFLVLMFCWFPLYSLFNLLEIPTSYFCRFSYLQIFGILFMAAWALLGSSIQPARLRISAAVYAVILLVVYFYAPYEEKLPVFLTALVIAVFSLLWGTGTQILANSKTGKNVFSGLLALLLIADLTAGSQLQLQYFARSKYAGPDTSSYISGQQDLIHALQEHDPGQYRISQTRNRWTDPGRWTANYDEPLAYGYWSITEYSSTASGAQLDFLQHAGYRTEADVISIVNTPVLGIDSLLGVRYILSDLPVNGLVEQPDIPVFDGKRTYYNPYSLPMAFRISSSGAELSESQNPFEFQNSLYSALLGEEKKLYKPIEFESAFTGEQGTNSSVHTYRLQLPDGNVAVYGNLPWDYYVSLPTLDLNGKDSSVYNGWLAPAVFYVPTDAGDSQAEVTLTGRTTINEGKEQFYALDLDLLKQATEALQSRPVESGDFKNGSITIHTNAKAGEMLFLSVPADKGWQIRLNGESVTPELFADLFYTIPLREGENNLTMHYRIPYLTEGVLLSVLGLGLLLSSILISRKRRI